MSNSSIIDDTAAPVFFDYDYSAFYGGNSGKPVNEFEILVSDKHIMLIGETGSGKSVALKRIMVRFFALTKSNYLFPILVDFRRLKKDGDLYTYIAQAMGITFQAKVESEEFTKIKETPSAGSYSYEPVVQHRQTTVHYIQGFKLNEFMINLLKHGRFLLFFDGFNEVRPLLKMKVEQQIEELSRGLTNSKIILTCRPHFALNECDHFRRIGLKKLTYKKQMEILDKATIDNMKLRARLNLLTDDELFRLPGNFGMMINIVMAIYPKAIKVVKNSSDLYDLFIQVSIRSIASNQGLPKRWESSSSIESLGINMVYETEAYPYTRSNGDGPMSDKSDIMSFQKVENYSDFVYFSQRGLIQFNSYAIYEYLAAKYQTTRHYLSDLKLYIELYCDPVAYSVCQSEKPVELFYEIISLVKRKFRPNKAHEICKQLISKLSFEPPNFQKHEKLGVSFLNALTIGNEKDAEYIQIYRVLFKKQPVIVDSIRLVLNKYTERGHHSNPNVVSYRLAINHIFNFYPHEFSVPIALKNLMLVDSLQ